MKKIKKLVLFHGKFHIGLSFFVLLISFLVGKKFLLLFNYLLALSLHEFAHLFVAISVGYKLKKVNLDMFGISVELGEEVFHEDEFKIAIAGPLFNLFVSIICVASYWIFPLSYMILHEFCFCNLILALFNLLPIYPLDGGRVLRSVFGKNSDYKKLDKVLRVVVAAVCLFLFVVTIKTLNIFLFLIAVFFLMSSPRNEPNFALLKKKKRRIERVEILHITGEEKVLDLLKKINTKRYTIFYFYDGGDVYINEDRIIDFAASKGVNFTLKFLIKH